MDEEVLQLENETKGDQHWCLEIADDVQLREEAGIGR